MKEQLKITPMKKVILSVLVAASVLTGNVAIAQTQNAESVKKEKQHKHQRQSVDEQVAHLKTELGLREDQVPQVKEAITAHREAMKSLKKANKDNTDKAAAKEQFKAERKAFKEKMKSILNEAQYKKYEEMMKERRKAHKGNHKKDKQKKAE
jgi:hypothetical protein